MISHVYAVFDRASGVYDRPFPALTDQAAIRSFGDVVMDTSHPIGKHPGDFTLMRVGSWNDNTGKLEGSVPEKIINGLEFSVEDINGNGEIVRKLGEDLNQLSSDGGMNDAT